MLIIITNRTIVWEHIFCFGERKRLIMKNAMEDLLMTEREQRNIRWKQQRKKEIRNRWILLIIILWMTIAFAIVFHAMVSRAESNQEQLKSKYFTSIKVEYGDSLWSIAKHFMGEEYHSEQSYIAEVIRINHLENTSLKIGQSIIIPYYAE